MSRFWDHTNLDRLVEENKESITFNKNEFAILITSIKNSHQQLLTSVLNETERRVYALDDIGDTQRLQVLKILSDLRNE